MKYAILTQVLLPLAAAANMYTKSSPVLQLDAKSYDKLVAKSNYTSMVEFYAPWCGHCQNLKPAYEKAATSLDGMARVAAVNCDEDANKPFCGTMGIKGFPTLKIVKPAKKAGGRPVVEDYNGGRTAKAIKEALLDRIPNHVAKVRPDGLEKWMKDAPARPKAVFVGSKGLVPPFVKALAVDFKGVVDVGYARAGKDDADAEMLKTLGVSGAPAAVVIPSSGAAPVTYDGEMKKAPLLEFLSQYASPNPDARPQDQSSSKGKAKKNKGSKPKKEL